MTIPLSQGYIKKLRYCDYLGKYFCDGCHGGLESVIPGRVLNNWDFARYPVCHFSRQLLDSIWQQPLFKLTGVAKNLYSQAKELQRFRVSVSFFPGTILYNISGHRKITLKMLLFEVICWLIVISVLIGCALTLLCRKWVCLCMTHLLNSIHMIFFNYTTVQKFLKESLMLTQTEFIW